MCQEVIKEFLCCEPTRWFTARDIVDGTGLSLNAVFNACMDMRRSHTVLFSTRKCLVGRSMKDVIIYKYKRC